MRDLLQDLRYAVRMLRKRPGASAVIVLTLAFGIGINATFFSNYYAMALRPLPFDDPHELIQLHRSEPDAGRRLMGVAEGTLLDWRDRQEALAGLGAFTYQSFNLHADELPERVEGAEISADLFPLLGVEPARGRSFTAEEDRPGSAKPALVGHALWQRSLGGDPEVVGRALEIDGETYEIVGVMPEGFAFPLWQEVWIPLGLDPEAAPRGSGPLQVIGRLREGVDLPTARRIFENLSRRETEEHPEVPEGMTVNLVPLHDAWMPPITRVAGLVMQGLVTLVLLIVCTNVANMILAQATVRRRELALRAALGAGRARLTRQGLIESLVPATLGGGLGLLAAAWQTDWVEAISSIPLPYWLSFELEPPIVIFTAVVTVTVAVMIGLVPNLGGVVSRVSETLKSGGRGGSDGGGKLRGLLVVAEYSMAVIILVGALLMVRAYQRVAESDQGFAVDQRVALSLSLTGKAFDDYPAGLDLVERALDRVAGVPGVSSVAATSVLPISRGGYRSARLEIEGRRFEPGEAPAVTVQAVSSGYFETLEIPRVRGRGFHLEEQRGEGVPAIVDQGFADSLWPGEDPLGRRLRTGSDQPWMTVVGTVGRVRPAESIAGIDPPPEHQLYLPLGFSPDGSYRNLSRTPSLVIASSAPVAALGPTLRRELAELDSRVAIYGLQTMQRHVEQHYFAQLIWSRMFSVIGFFALVIAALGAYGVSAFSVSRRTREMGIRLALGEAPAALMARVMGQGLRLAVIGLGFGLIAALPLADAMEKLLHGVGAADPWVIAGVIALLATVALAAGYFPARRAATVDPVRALRED